MPEYEILVDGKPRKIELTKTGEVSFNIKVDGKPRSIELGGNAPNFEKPFTVRIDNESYQVEVHREDLGRQFSTKVEEATFKVEVKVPTRKVISTAFQPIYAAPTRKAAVDKQSLEGAITAPMTGKIVSVKVKKGDDVKAGQVLCVIEAMKMENEIAAPKAGVVKEVYVSDGSSVSEGEPLLIIG